MNRTRILLVLYDMSLSGAPRVALQTFGQLRDELDIRVVSEHGGPLEPAFRRLWPSVVLRGGRLGLLLERLGKSGPATLAGQGLFGRIRSRLVMFPLLGWRPDLVYVNSVASLPSYARMVWVRRLRVPTVIHVHEAEVALRDHEEFLGMIADANRVLAVSNGVKDALVGIGVDPARVAVIPPFVERRWLDAGTVFRGGEPSDSTPIVVGGAGAPSWTKGIELWLLTAAELVQRHGPAAFRFVWVGLRDDDASRHFGAMVAKLGLRQTVRLVPEVPDPTSEYSAFDFLLIASWEESASLVSLELMALGKIVACFAGSGGPVELLGDVGIVVDDFSPHRMADAIAEVAFAPERRAGLSQMARERARTRYTGADVVPRVLEEIHSAVRSPNGPDYPMT